MAINGPSKGSSPATYQLPTLAMLKAQVDKGGTRDRQVRPFLVEVIRTRSHPDFSSTDIQGEVATVFGLLLPNHIVVASSGLCVSDRILK